MTSTIQPTAGLPDRMLDWYDRHRRVLPWRAGPGERSDPYRVWLSEIMLQQTTVAAVGPYFRSFVERWPTVESLAAAELDDVLHAWAGLGYYARARNLHRCARVVATELGGRFPDTEEGLRQLPGIGDYTAAAVAAIAFDRPAAVLDGNIERVIARVFAVEEPLPGVRAKLRGLARGLTPEHRPGDYAQALMDLGSAVCTPKRPHCILCPWADACAARRAGIAEDLPRRRAKAVKPTRRGIAFWLINPAGEVLLHRRGEDGLLGGMMEIPSTGWDVGPAPALADVLAEAPAATEWRMLPGVVRHTFTHFHLELEVAVGRAADGCRPDGTWGAVDRLRDFALPALMHKIVRHVLAKAGAGPV